MQDKQLGQFLKKIRKSYCYTQEYVASQLNIIHQTYSHYETGRIIPPTDSLYNLAKLYNLSIEDLMRYTVKYQVSPGCTPLQPELSADSKDLSNFLEYVEHPTNQKKFKSLNRREKELLYYFQQLSLDSQDEIIDILKLKHQRLLKKHR